ncbi:hypothetical protein [Nonomuraea helvata]|uniref:Uncharacterized protein n=1 Tax=Nonomuraea helvata TaxID=37484 RepID=A0ABV5RTL5_9ACTN
MRLARARVPAQVPDALFPELAKGQYGVGVPGDQPAADEGVGGQFGGARQVPQGLAHGTRELLL